MRNVGINGEMFNYLNLIKSQVGEVLFSLQVQQNLQAFSHERLLEAQRALLSTLIYSLYICCLTGQNIIGLNSFRCHGRMSYHTQLPKAISIMSSSLIISHYCNYY